ncbi:isochorismatase family protein [Sphingomonas faeni]|uniref:isochorismatase family protein n=1 Tax=Sphingomonas faeni TaxID=185950 RepID=UPI00278A6BAE|nr:isochorismatase family protein [Sphingomonas faeni]MDQ0839293.1 hypothetical protein [Sphingomonas faeni]
MMLPSFNVNDCVLVLVDHAPRRTPEEGMAGEPAFHANALALARAAEDFNVPVVRSPLLTESENFDADLGRPSELADLSVIEEYPTRCCENERVRREAFRTRRGALIFAGGLSEALISYSILSALADTYDVLIVVDACDGLDPTARNLALRRMSAAGATMTTSKELLLRFEVERQWHDGGGANGTPPTGLAPQTATAFAPSTRLRQFAED